MRLADQRRAQRLDIMEAREQFACQTSDVTFVGQGKIHKAVMKKKDISRATLSLRGVRYLKRESGSKLNGMKLLPYQ